MELPKNEDVFVLDHVGALTGRRYEGTFTVRCILNIAQKHAMELEKTRLLGNYSSPSDELFGIALVLSTLRAKIIDAPEWWKQGKGADLLDEDVLTAMYDKVKDTENKWRQNLQDKAEAAKQTQIQLVPAQPLQPQSSTQ